MASWQIVIKDLQGQTIRLEVRNAQTATVHDVKRLIAEKDSNMPVFEQRLVFERTQLEDSRKLCSYPGIEDGCSMHLIRLIPFQVFVKGMDGSSYTFRIPSRTPESFSVSNFKKMVQERTQVRPEEQRLQYAGKQLVDSLTLGDYNIVNNATLHLVSRLRGGSVVPKAINVCVLTKQYTNTMRMPCGHSVSTQGLYNYCLASISQKRDVVCCPSCSSEWTMKTLRGSTDLTKSQLEQIDEGFTRNYCLKMPGVVTCRGCNTVWSSNTMTDNLCSSCAVKRHDGGKKATVELLANCPVKIVDHAAACPKLRSCPKCGIVIEHESACRRVQCNNCQTMFCFICLAVRSPTCSEYYPCLVQPCATAARQTYIPTK